MTKKTNTFKATPKKKSKLSRKQTQESTKETQDIQKYGLITTKTTNNVRGTTGTTGRTEYYTSQGQPPDNNQQGCKTQSKIQDFFKPTLNP